MHVYSNMSAGRLATTQYNCDDDGTGAGKGDDNDDDDGDDDDDKRPICTADR